MQADIHCAGETFRFKWEKSENNRIMMLFIPKEIETSTSNIGVNCSRAPSKVTLPLSQRTRYTSEAGKYVKEVHEHTSVLF